MRADQLGAEWEATGETLDQDAVDRIFNQGAPKSDTPPPAKVRKTGTLSLSNDWEATGEVVDGDTLRLMGGTNGRLYGFDAFERGQPGYRSDGTRVDLGGASSDMLSAYVRPSQSVTGVGKQTFSRPVITLGDDADDPVIKMLWQGAGYAAPDYLRDDPQRAASYTEAERLGRLNRQGGFGTGHVRPDAYRRPLTTRTAKLAADEYLVFDDQLPTDAPKLKRLTPQQEGKIARYIASQAGNKNFTLQQYRDWFRNDLGVTDIEPSDNPKFIEDVRKGEGFSPAVDYAGLDTEAKRELEELIAFSGLRPEDAEGYRDLLNRGDQAQVLDYASSKGMTLDPRDVDAFFEARAKGEKAPIPLPLINPGDGRFGAAARGFGDPLGFLDEMGAVPDALGLTPYRESVWNSDRSFGDVYENNVRQNRAIIDFDETNHPYYRAGGQLVSGFALPFGAGVRGVSGLAKAGAIEGGVYGFGSGDGTLGDRIANVPVNAAIGAGGGMVIGTVLEVLTPPARALLSRLRGDARAERVLTDEHRAAAFSDALEREVGDNADGISEEQLERAFAAADNVATPDEALPSIPEGFRLEANTDAEDALPTLSSQPLPSQPRPLLDDPDIAAAAEGVRPEDVIPRAADEIADADEAARIGEGLYPEVAAPRERDVLESRQFPSRANPDNMLSRKGPLDLAAYVRSKGGVADFRGELKAAGLSNAPRKGDDFAGGENRLGPLLNDESGSTLDDMAQQAWEAGYFPDHATRPTVDEFVSALGDTYRGVNRTFRPDDFAEVDSFNAARDQRLAVERARQEGAPLADDLGQPATLDDMIANTPPALDPDDWNPAALAKVGNVRVDKLDTPQEISRALKVGHDIAGGFDNARRGVITQAETEALASDLGMTADQLLARRKGQALNAEEALAARRILAKSSNELVNMARRIQRAGDEPGSELLATFRKAMVRHTAIQEQVSGATAEAGRALQSFRMAADSREIPGRVLEGLVNAGGGPHRMKEAAEMILTLDRDPARLNHFVDKATKPRFKDKLVEIWYNYLLSGPQTHAVNTLSNTMTALAQLPEHAVAAGVGKARTALRRDQATADRIAMSEVGARATGLLQGTKEGMREIAARFRAQPGDGQGIWETAKRWGNAIADAEPSDFITKVENQSQKAVGGLKGKLLRLPSSALTIEDEFFKAIARRMELTGLAVRKARMEGLKGQEARDRAAELVANPTDEILLRSFDYARYLTFQRQLGPVASKLSAMTTAAPVLKGILPFVRTPTNLIKFAGERSPFAPVMESWRKDFAAGGARRDLAIAKVMVGSGIGAAIAELAPRGIITGSEPSDRNRRALMLADNWQPYSVKIGDTYYSYRRLDPFAMTIGTAADIATLGNGMTESQREKGAALLVASIMSNLANKTWLTGISDALDSLQDPERSAGRFVNRLIGSATVPTGVAQVARTIDPTMRETEGPRDYVQSRIPGLSKNLFPRRDIWGEPIVGEGGVGPDIVSPIWTRTQRNDPITKEVLRVDATVSKPQRRDMTLEQYDKLQATAGPLARKWLGDMFDTSDYRALDTEDQATEIGKVMAQARKAAKAHVLEGEPLPEGRPVKGRRKVKSTSPPVSLGDMSDWEVVR